MYDYHIHSEYSMDSNTPMEDIIKSAIEKNLKAICITDHVDLGSGIDNVDHSFDTKAYFKHIDSLKEKYADEVELFAGVELGMQTHVIEKSNAFIEESENFRKFDYILMSIHGVNEKDIAMDRFTDGLDPLEALKSYYEAMYACVKDFDNFDMLGHIDYIDRYFSNFDEIPDFESYKAYVEPVLKVLIEKDKGMEINTAGLRYNLGYFHPKLEILKMYKDLGGTVLTLGSDSHTPETLSFAYDEIVSAIKEIGFDSLYIFKERKRIKVNI